MAGHAVLDDLIARISSQSSSLSTPMQSILREDTLLSFLSPAEREAMRQMQLEQRWTQTISCTGPGLLTRTIFSFLKKQSSSSIASYSDTSAPCSSTFDPSLGLQLLTTEVFSPVPNNVRVSLTDDGLAAREAAKAQFVSSDSTLAIHWWQRSWQR